ncbi:MAG: TerB family tellurite resistance protein [Candidatus Binatia bacterium]
MPLLRLFAALGLRLDDESPPAARPLLPRLRDELSRRGGARLEYLAAFAGQLARVAEVEGGISAEEAAAMAARLRAAGNLSEADATLIAEMLRHERDGLAGLPAQELTRAINDGATPEEKQALLDCLYAVAAADRLVSDAEEREIRRVAEAILVPHRVLMEIRARYRDRLEALQNLPRGGR